MSDTSSINSEDHGRETRSGISRGRVLSPASGLPGQRAALWTTTKDLAPLGLSNRSGEWSGIGRSSRLASVHRQLQAKSAAKNETRPSFFAALG